MSEASRSQQATRTQFQWVSSPWSEPPIGGGLQDVAGGGSMLGAGAAGADLRGAARFFAAFFLAGAAFFADFLADFFAAFFATFFAPFFFFAATTFFAFFTFFDFFAFAFFDFLAIQYPPVAAIRIRFSPPRLRFAP
jgi:hypothetical protein